MNILTKLTQKNKERMYQLSHASTKNNVHQFSITLVCDQIRTPENIGMIFRIAESFGVPKIYLHSRSPSIDNKKVKRISRNTFRALDVEVYDDFTHLITDLKKENHIIGIELTDESTPLPLFNFKNYQNIVLVLGAERNGIKFLETLDNCVQIEMYGSNSSMNVVNSLAIVLYEVTNQLKSII